MKLRNYDRKGPYKFANICKDEIYSVSNPTPIKDRLILGSVEVGNSSGSDAACGFGYKLPDAQWKAGQYDASATPDYIDDTTDAQDAGAGDFALTTTTNDDGFVVQADKPFNVLGITISTAAGSTPTVTYQYWGTSGWTTLTTLATPDLEATGDQYLVFLEPHDWDALESGDSAVSTEGLTAGKYAIKVITTTAPSSAALATKLWLVDLLDYVEKVGDGNSIVFDAVGEYKVPGTAPLVPYCSTANAANWMIFEYRKG